MAKRKKSNGILAKLLIAIVFIIMGVFGIEQFQEITPLDNVEEQTVAKIEIDEQKLEVLFLDVGQADSILILNQGQAMLIDAGNDENGEQIVKQIQALGITQLDYVIVTHMHADHMGGMDKVINSTPIKNIYMPDTIHTTRQVEEMLEAMEDNGLTYQSPNIGDSFSLGNANCEIIHIDNTETEDLNNSSIVVELTFKTQKFLFMGDAETQVEDKLQLGKINVLKVGHHGSSTSSSQNFISQIRPEIAVISVGKDNSYHHPNENVIKRLEQYGATIYRTDEQGTIWISSDGTQNIIKKISEEN